MRHSWVSISESIDQCNKCKITRENCSGVFLYSGSTLIRPSCIAREKKESIKKRPDFKRNNDTAQKQEFIRENKDEFKIYFIDEFYNWRDMHKKYPRSKYYSPPAIAMGHRLRKIFGYSNSTSTYNILNHFKKLFIKLYPEYEFQTVKRQIHQGCIQGVSQQKPQSISGI